MVTEPPSRGVVLMTTLFTLSVIGLILFVWTSLGGSVPLQARGYRVTAVFPDASQLVTHADVRIAGVTVGEVTKIRAVGLDTRATIQIDHRYAPLPRDVRAILRQKTLLGETFVQLTPGNPRSGRLEDGGVIPASQIGVRQPLDRLLGALDKRTRQNIHDLLNRTSVALDGRGNSLNDAIGDLDPFSAELATITKLLDHQSGDVRSLVRDSATVLDTVSSRDSDLAGAVNNGRSVLAATAARDRALTATIRALPGFVTQLRDTGRALDHTAALATPTLIALKPGAKAAPEALRTLDALAPRATNLFRQFRSLIPVARTSLPAATRMVTALVPFSEVLNPAARDIVPVINVMAAYKNELRGAITNVGAALNLTQAATGGRTRHVLRALVPINDEGLIGATSRAGTNRHNAYPAPGTWNAIGREGLPASDCRDAGNPAGLLAAAPACHVQAPWEFAGVKAYYPHLLQAQPSRRR